MPSSFSRDNDDVSLLSGDKRLPHHHHQTRTIVNYQPLASTIKSHDPYYDNDDDSSLSGNHDDEQSKSFVTNAFLLSNDTNNRSLPSDNSVYDALSSGNSGGES